MKILVIVSVLVLAIGCSTTSKNSEDGISVEKYSHGSDLMLPACDNKPATQNLYEQAEKKISEDIDAAIKQLIELANLGHAGAAHDLGLIYVTGKSVEQDYEKAYLWFSKAASLGLHNSMYSLGIMNKLGEGRSKNKSLAYAWYSLAGDYIPKNWSEWTLPRGKVAMYMRADDAISKEMSKDEIAEGKKLRKKLELKIKCNWNPLSDNKQFFGRS